MKADKNANTIILDSEDVQLITKAIAKAAQESFKTTKERQEEILGMVTDLLKFCVKRLNMLKWL